jgi:hypothetical protein
MSNSKPPTTTGYFKQLKREHPGIKVEDSKTRRKLIITEQDTKYALPGCSKFCVAARKLKKSMDIEAANFFTNVAHVIEFDRKKRQYVNKRYSISKPLKAAIKTFDQKNPFPTGTYELIPIEREKKKDRKKGKGESKEAKAVRDSRRGPRKRGVVGGPGGPKPRAQVRQYRANWATRGLSGAGE